MAVDMFLKLDGIKGESQDDKHKDTIDVLAWSWGLSNATTLGSGGGGGSGKVNFQDISITKKVDKSSNALMLNCATGQHIKQADLVVRKAGGKQLEYIKIKLEDVLVSSVHTGGSGGETELTENVTLSFAKVNFEYSPQKADGSGDAGMKFGYDIKKNVKL